MLQLARLIYPIDGVNLDDYPELMKSIEDDWDIQTKAWKLGIYLINLVEENILNINADDKYENDELDNIINTLAHRISTYYLSTRNILEDLEETSKFVHKFIRWLLEQEQSTDLIEKLIKIVTENNIIKSEYSLNSAYEMLNGDINHDEQIIIFTKKLLYSRDYFNLDFLQKIRSIIIEYFTPKTLCRYMDDINHQSDFLSLFKSDFKFPWMLSATLLSENGYKITRSKKYVRIPKFPKIFNNRFIYVCCLEYSKFILNMYMLIFLYSKPAPYRNIRYEHLIGGFLLLITMLLYDIVKTKLTEREKIALLMTMFLDNICNVMQQSFDSDRFKKLKKLVAQFSRVKKQDYLDEIIEEIGEMAKNLWQKEDSQLDHIDMALSFKSNEKYAKYFAENNFESRLKKKMKEVCIKNEIPKIRGVNVFRKNFKRSSKKK